MGSKQTIFNTQKLYLFLYVIISTKRRQFKNVNGHSLGSTCESHHQKQSLGRISLKKVYLKISQKS